MSIALWQRTKHPSGSRPPWMPRSVARYPAPGTLCAPENPRYPAVSNRDKHSAYGSPLRGHPNAGSRQRRRKHPTSRLEAICQRVRPGLISVAGSEPSRLQASRLTLTWSRQLIQTPGSRRKAPAAASCDNMPGPTCAPRPYGPPTHWFGPACADNTAALSD